MAVTTPPPPMPKNGGLHSKSLPLMPQQRILASACAAILVLLLAACGGGGSDSPAVVAPPVVSLAGTDFFREPGQVIVGTPVALSAGTASAAVRWRLAQRPASSMAALPGSGASASLVPDVPGEYVVEARFEDATTSSSATTTTIRAIPNQIEFNLKVVNSNGQTALWVTPVRTNAPMSDCLVYTAVGCAPPAQVEFYFDGSSRSAYTGILTRPEQFMFWNPMDTAPLVGAPHEVRAVVTAPGEFGLAGNRREAILTFSVTSPTQTDPFGGPPTASVDLVGVPSADVVGQVGAVEGKRVGDTVTVTTTTTGVLTGLQASIRFVDRPAGSTAMLNVDQAAGTATFRADRVGRYTIEYTPLFADGTRASPAYATANVTPHVTTINAEVQDSSSSLFFLDDPKPAAGVTRVYLINTTSTRGVSAVEAFLGGAPLAQSQIQRFSGGGHGGAGAGWYPQRVYDIPDSSLAGGDHALVIRVTDTLGRQWEATATLPGFTRLSEEFEDTAP